MRQHTERKMSQFRKIKAIRAEISDPANKAVMVKMDWSENATLFQCQKEKSAYYHDIQASINTTVIYTADGTKCAGSISDVKDHIKRAVCTSLNFIMKAVEIDPAELDLLYITTYSPI